MSFVVGGRYSWGEISAKEESHQVCLVNLGVINDVGVLEYRYAHTMCVCVAPPPTKVRHLVQKLASVHVCAVPMCVPQASRAVVCCAVAKHASD